MKTKLFLGVILLCGNLSAQIFQNSMAPGGVIDLSNSSIYNPGYSNYVNYENRIHNYESNLMNAYLTMYESTKNPVYLDKFIEHAKGVIDRRVLELGLNRQADPNFLVQGVPSGVSLPYIFAPEPAWPTRLNANDPWSAELISNGIIAKPLAQFAYMIKVKYPALASRIVPSSAAGTDITSWYVIANYGDFAEMMVQKIDQTARVFFDQLWSNGDMCYYESFFNFDDFASPNCMTSLGRVHTYMYKIYDAEGNVALRDYYRHKIRRIAQRLVNPAQTNFTRDQVNHIVRWNYGALDEPGETKEREDIAHGLIVMEFADLCNLFDIRDENNLPLFDNNLMYDFANTFKTKLISAPMRYSMSITGVELDQRQIGYNPHETTFGSFPEGSLERYEQYLNAGRYLFLARHIPDIYNMIADYFYEFSLYGPFGYPHYCNNATSQIYGLDAVAQLANGKKGYAPVYTNYLEIASVKRQPTYQPGSDLTGTEKWAGVVAGKFDANKAAQSIALFNSLTARIEIREYDAQKKISNVVAFWNLPPHTTMPIWGSVAAGDIIPGNNCDEIVAFNKVNNYFYLFKQVGSAVTLVATFGVGKNCAGIATGNFNTTVGDEVIFLSKDDGRMYLYKFTTATNQFSQLAISNNATFTYVVSNPAGIAVGNLDNNASNGLEIATINNNTGSDYNIKIYNLNSSTLAFGPTVYQYTGTGGSYSQWDAITTGDFNADGFDELMLHRQNDGDFHIQYLDGGVIKHLCKENFPTNWTLGFFCGVKFSGDNTEHLVSLRNNDGHIFTFKPSNMPSIPNRPQIPEGPITGRMQTASEDMVEQEHTLKEWNVLSLDEMDLANSIQIYPNPSEGVFVIESENEKITQIRITNATGTLVYESNAYSTNNRFKIDLSDQSSGVYLIEITTEVGSTIKRMIKK